MKKYSGILMCFFLTISAITSGCSNSYDDISQERYQMYTQTEGSIRFSLEYPDDCEVALSEISNNTVYIGFDRSLDEKYWDGYSLYILVGKQSAVQYINASAKLEGFLNTTANSLVEFNLVQKTKVNISGIQGEQIYYSYTVVPMLDGEHDVRADTPVESRRIYFDHSEYIYTIGVISPIETYKNDFNAFDHLIKSFKILD